MAASDYESAYEGQQMDEAFSRVLGMLIGSAAITAQADGDGFAQVDIGEGYGAHKIFCSARCTSISGNMGVICASVDYSAETGIATLRISGDGVEYGERYEFDYMLVQ